MALQLAKIILLLLICYTVKAQIDSTFLHTDIALIRKDPVFDSLLIRNITYPWKAIRKRAYGNIYAGFRVDQKGHIQDIIMLDEDSKVGFEKEVKRALSKLPSLNPKYEGLYVLPIVFGYSVDGKEISTNYILPEKNVTGRIVLEKLKFLYHWLH